MPYRPSHSARAFRRSDGKRPRYSSAVHNAWLKTEAKSPLGTGIDPPESETSITVLIRHYL